jgi:HEAT repeat protein
VKTTADEVFARQGVDLLAQTADPAAAWGLSLAVKSEMAQVRQDACEALAWRGDEPSLAVLGESLGDEAEARVARAGVSALVRRRDKAALTALVGSLNGKSRAAMPEILDGLGQLTGHEERDRDAWRRWWEENKDRTDLIRR